MSSVTSSDIPQLLRALDAIRNGRAYLALLLGGFVAVLITAGFGFLASRLAIWGMPVVGIVTSLLGSLIAVVIFMIAYSAAGVSLLDQARGLPGRSFGDLFFAGLSSLGRLLLLGLLLLAIYVAVAIVILLLLFIAKIPVLGPLIYFVVFPLSALSFGLFGFIVLFVVNPLAGPAIWDGSGVMQTVAKLAKVARESLLKVVLSQSLLFLMLLFAAGILYAVVFSGIGVTSSLSTLILGGGRHASLFYDPMGVWNSVSRADAANYLVAGGIGSGLLVGAASMAVLLIAISGTCHIYLAFAANVDASDMEGALRAGAQQLKAKAEAAREQARQQAAAAQKAWQERQEAARAASATATSDGGQCVQCKQPIAPDDVFCGHCGHRQPGHD